VIRIENEPIAEALDIENNEEENEPAQEREVIRIENEPIAEAVDIENQEEIEPAQEGEVIRIRIENNGPLNREGMLPMDPALLMRNPANHANHELLCNYLTIISLIALGLY